MLYPISYQIVYISFCFYHVWQQWPLTFFHQHSHTHSLRYHQYIRKYDSRIHTYLIYGLQGNSSAAGLGIDWTVTPQLARKLTGGNITLQGNFDPSRLLAPISEIKKSVKEMIDGFGTQRYIANLGHGILPNVPVDHARAFVDAVKEYSMTTAQQIA